MSNKTGAMVHRLVKLHSAELIEYYLRCHWLRSSASEWEICTVPKHQIGIMYAATNTNILLGSKLTSIQ